MNDTIIYLKDGNFAVSGQENKPVINFNKHLKPSPRKTQFCSSDPDDYDLEEFEREELRVKGWNDCIKFLNRIYGGV